MIFQGGTLLIALNRGVDKEFYEFHHFKTMMNAETSRQERAAPFFSSRGQL